MIKKFNRFFFRSFIFLIISSTCFSSENSKSFYLNIESRLNEKKNYENKVIKVPFWDNSKKIKNTPAFSLGKNLINCELSPFTQYSRDEILIICLGNQTQAQVGFNCKVNNSRKNAVFFFLGSGEIKNDGGALNTYLWCSEKK